MNYITATKPLTQPLTSRGAEYCDQSVCVCVCGKLPLPIRITAVGILHVMGPMGYFNTGVEFEVYDCLVLFCLLSLDVNADLSGFTNFLHPLFLTLHTLTATHSFTLTIYLNYKPNCLRSRSGQPH